MFGKYYQDELAFLREMGREFAQAYPALAPMLADRGADPDVERLLEGVAFLTGRIREKLDDELPEAIHAITNLLFPQLVRPLPGATILEITPLPNVLREPHRVEAGTEFASIPVDGTSCVFRSTAPCDLAPWTIEDVRLEQLPAGRQQLRVEMKVQLGLPVTQVAPERVRLHLAGESRAALALLMWIHQHTDEVVLIESKASRFDEREVRIGKRALHAVGFEEDESLLPFPRAAFPGFRLLQEYYTLPAKFAFVDVEGVGRVAELDPEIARFAIAFRFDAPVPHDVRVNRDSVKLHCVPVVNIFATTAEPIRLDPARERFPVRVAGLSPAHGEIYSIERAECVGRGTGKRTPVHSFYEFSHVGAAAAGRIFYTTHVEPSVVGEGADIFISFNTPEDSGTVIENDVVSLDILATNRQIASALRAGEVSVATASSPAVATFRNIVAVSPHVPPPLGRELQWRVVAHASMGLRSLTEPEVLRAVLDVYNLHAIVDRQAGRANELRLSSLKDVRVSASERLYRGSAIRGVDIEIDVDERGFVGDGDVFLFGSILEQFFASYVSLNSYARTSVVGVQSKVRYAWPARSGSLTLL